MTDSEGPGNRDDNLKVSKGQKLEDFDFYELTSDLANSLTDQLYRDYLPVLEEKYREQQQAFHDENIKNDLRVDELVSKIKENIDAKLSIDITEQISKRVLSELNEQYHSSPGSPEYFLDQLVRGIRWIMAPSFLLMSLVVLSLFFVIAAEVYNLMGETLILLGQALDGKSINELSETINMIVAAILSTLDIILIGSLVIMVLVGGYENTISRIGMSHEVPTWFGKLNLSQLKIKVAASIVIISSIHLLMAFMQVEVGMKDFDHRPLMWTAIVHVVFVVAAVALAYMDRLTSSDH